MTSVETETDDYPEHAKQALISDQAQAIGEFIDTSGYSLVDASGHTPYATIERILADYFGIDLNKIESEKRTMLARVRGTNE